MADEAVRQAGWNIDQDAEQRFGKTHPLNYLRSLVRQHGKAASEQMAKLVVKKWTVPTFRSHLWELIDYVDKLEPDQLSAWQSYLKLKHVR